MHDSRCICMCVCMHDNACTVCMCSLCASASVCTHMRICVRTWVPSTNNRKPLHFVLNAVRLVPDFRIDNSAWRNLSLSDWGQDDLYREILMKRIHWMHLDALIMDSCWIFAFDLYAQEPKQNLTSHNLSWLLWDWLADTARITKCCQRCEAVPDTVPATQCQCKFQIHNIIACLPNTLPGTHKDETQRWMGLASQQLAKRRRQITLPKVSFYKDKCKQ